MATVVEPHRRLRLVAGPGAVLGRRLGHDPRRRAGRPRLRRAGLRRAARRDRHQPGHRDPAAGAARRSASTPTRPGRRPAGQLLADTARAALAAAEPGSGFQLAWARAFAARGPPPPRTWPSLRGWLDGVGVPAGLAIDTDLRWSLLSRPGRPRRGRARPRSRPSSTATAPPAASGRPPWPTRWCRPRSRRPRRGAGSPATRSCRTGCSARCCRASTTRRSSR